MAEKVLTFQSLTLAAAASRRVAVTGRLLVITEASAQVMVRAGEGEEFPAQSGFTVDLGQFTSLTFRNPSATASVSIQFYVGNAQVSFLLDQFRNRSTAIGYQAGAYGSYTTIDGGDYVSFSGVDSAGRIRKQIIVFNNDATEDVHVTLPMGGTGCKTLAIIPARTSWTVETSAPIAFLSNKAIGQQHSIAVLETFYQ